MKTAIFFLCSIILFSFLIVSCEKDEEKPIASFTMSKTSAEVGEAISFTNTSKNATTYNWDFGDGSTSTDENPTYTYSTDGTFTITLTSTGEGGESSTSLTIAISYSVPVASFSGSPTSLKEGENVTFTDASQNNPISWQWEFEGGEPATSTEQNPTITYNNAGTYKVTLTVTNEGGSDSKSENEYIVVEPYILTDIDGNTYDFVKIGNQVWMAENLAVTHFNDGTEIPNVKDRAWGGLSTPAYNSSWTIIGDDSMRPAGALYNWYVIETGKVCPTGWHVPSHDEWKKLTNYLIENGYNYDGSTSENKIAKSLADTILWRGSSTPGATGNDLSSNNSSGFSALPCGRREDSQGAIEEMDDGFWWSGTESDSVYWCRLRYKEEGLSFYGANEASSSTDRLNDLKQMGLSIRCLKD